MGTNESQIFAGIKKNGIKTITLFFDSSKRTELYKSTGVWHPISQLISNIVLK